MQVPENFFMDIVLNNTLITKILKNREFIIIKEQRKNREFIIILFIIIKAFFQIVATFKTMK